MKSILADQKARDQIDAMARVFTKVDRVLSGAEVTCKVEQCGQSFPAYTDGKQIVFNSDLIGEVTKVDDLIRLSGLNYHELAHVLYTPRSSTPTVHSVRAEGLHSAFNILEDQRIETLLTSVYPSVIPYLVSAFLRYCLQKESAWEGNFVLAHGRRYLPVDVRREFRLRFKHQELIPQFSSIIDEYRKITYPVHAERGIELIRKFDALLKSVTADGVQISDPNGHSDSQRPDVDAGRPASTRDQKNASEKSDLLDEELDDDSSDSSSQGKSDKQDDQGDSDDTSGTGSESGDSDDTSDGSDSDSGQDGEGDSGIRGTGDISSESAKGSDQSEPAPTNSDAGGSGASAPSPVSDSDFRDLIDQEARAFEQLPDVQEEITERQRVIVNGDGEITIGISGKNHRDSLPSQEDVASVRKFTAVLDQLRADSDPGWSTHQGSGRLNVQRHLSGGEYDEIWDRWEEGNADAADIECVIIVDTSGSMNWCINGVSRSLWVIKRSLEALNASVTVLGFGHETIRIYDRNEPCSRTKYRSLSARGGTYAHDAVIQAVRVFESSKRKNKIFIAITDGQWSYSNRSNVSSPDELIAALGKRGVITALAFFGYAVYDNHNCQLSTAINQPQDLIGFAKAIVDKSTKVRR